MKLHVAGNHVGNKFRVCGSTCTAATNTIRDIVDFFTILVCDDRPFCRSRISAQYYAIFVDQSDNCRTRARCTRDRMTLSTKSQASTTSLHSKTPTAQSTPLDTSLDLARRRCYISSTRGPFKSRDATPTHPCVSLVLVCCASPDMSADVELFSTSILGNPVTRSRHDRYVTVLKAFKVC